MRSSPSPPDRAGLVYVALSGIAFGTLAIFGKAAGRLGIPLAELLGLRFGLAAVILWALLLARRQPLWIGRRRGGGMAAMGLLYVAQATAYFTSLRTVPAAVTSILLYAYPVLVTIAARVLLGERITRTRLAALGLAVAGVFLVVDPLGAGGHLDAGGVAFGLLSAAIYATYIVAGPRLLAGAPALLATAYIATVAGACFLVAAAVSSGLPPLDGTRLALTGGMALIATVVPASLFLAGLSRVGPTRAAILSTLEPATTALLAGLLLGEGLGPVRLLGGAGVLAAAVLIARSVPPALAEAPVRE